VPARSCSRSAVAVLGVFAVVGAALCRPAGRAEAAEPKVLLPWLSVEPQPTVAPAVLYHGPRTGKLIALTFDACSTSPPVGFDDKVIDALVATATPATLFLGGKWMLAERDRVQGLATLPLFELGVHGYTHPHMQALPDAAIREELELNDQVFFALTGRHAQLFRPPFGEYDERVVRISANLGLTTVMFDLPGGDADPHATKARLVEWIERSAKGGSIVVMHMNGRGWHTAEALPELIHAMRARGWTFVTVGELLEREREAGQLLAAAKSCQPPGDASPTEASDYDAGALVAPEEAEPGVPLTAQAGASSR
jgi:peptidoglycan-N-acetylglucosamine deacetylase